MLSLNSIFKGLKSVIIIEKFFIDIRCLRFSMVLLSVNVFEDDTIE